MVRLHLLQVAVNARFLGILPSAILKTAWQWLHCILIGCHPRSQVDFSGDLFFLLAARPISSVYFKTFDVRYLFAASRFDPVDTTPHYRLFRSIRH